MKNINLIFLFLSLLSIQVAYSQEDQYIVTRNPKYSNLVDKVTFWDSSHVNVSFLYDLVQNQPYSFEGYPTLADEESRLVYDLSGVPNEEILRKYFQPYLSKHEVSNDLKEYITFKGVIVSRGVNKIWGSDRIEVRYSASFYDTDYNGYLEKLVILSPAGEIIYEEKMHNRNRNGYILSSSDRFLIERYGSVLSESDYGLIYNEGGRIVDLQNKGETVFDIPKDEDMVVLDPGEYPYWNNFIRLKDKVDIYVFDTQTGSIFKYPYQKSHSSEMVRLHPQGLEIKIKSDTILKTFDKEFEKVGTYEF